MIEDVAVRKLIRTTLGRAGVSRIEIQRFPKQIAVIIHTAKPGIVIGRRGASVNALKTELEKMTNISGKNLRVDVVEVDRPEMNAQVVAESIAEQLERRVSHKRAMRQAVQRAMRAGPRASR